MTSTATEEILRRRARERRWRSVALNALTWGLAAFAFYFAAALAVYAFRHPEKTETQVLLETWDALLWR